MNEQRYVLLSINSQISILVLEVSSWYYYASLCLKLVYDRFFNHQITGSGIDFVHTIGYTI